MFSISAHCFSRFAERFPGRKEEELVAICDELGQILNGAKRDLKGQVRLCLRGVIVVVDDSHTIVTCYEQVTPSENGRASLPDVASNLGWGLHGGMTVRVSGGRVWYEWNDGSDYEKGAIPSTETSTEYLRCRAQLQMVLSSAAKWESAPPATPPREGSSDADYLYAVG